MKTSDPKLTAFVLGELNTEDAKAVKDAMLTNPSIAKEINEIESVVNRVSESFDTSEYRLSPSQRSKVLAAGSHANIEDINSAKKRSSKFVWIPAGVGIAAAVTLLATFSGGSKNGEVSFDTFSDKELHQRLSASSTAWTSDDNTIPAVTEKLQSAIQQSPEKYRNSAALRSLTPLANGSQNIENGQNWQIASEQASVFVPLACSNLSWNWLKSASENGAELNASMIRSEELSNAMKLPFLENFSFKGVGAGLEFAHCPWNKGNLLAIVHLHNKGEKDIKQVSLGISFSSEVEQFRLLGYSTGSSAIQAPTSATLDKNYQHTVVYELNLIQNPVQLDSLATLHLKVQGKESSLRYKFNSLESENLSPASNLAVAANYWAEVALSDKPKTELNNFLTQLESSAKMEKAKNVYFTLKSLIH